MNDRIALRHVRHLLHVSANTVTDMVERGELHRTAGPGGWEYSRAEVLALATKRAELFEVPDTPRRGRWPRRQGVGASV